MTRTVRVPRNPYADEPEAAFQSWVVETAELLGWLVFHDNDSRRDYGAGFPDLVLTHPWARRCLFVELKRQTGKVRADQTRWQEALLRAGCDVQVWRPQDRDYVLSILDWERRGVRITA